jgi:hypothetical protein
VKTFDGNDYRKRVLARLAGDFSIANPETGDPFFVMDLDLDETDQGRIAGRISDVVAFWQRERGAVKYKRIAADLVAERKRYAAILTDPTRRASAANRIRAERAAADAELFADLDRLAGQLEERFGGIPEDRIEQLRMLGRRKGLDDPAFAGWLSRHKTVGQKHGHAVPWEPGIRRQIRSQLDELARSLGDPVRYATLWSFLELSPSCADTELAARHAEMLAENHRSRHDAAKTGVGELLAHVRTRLMADGGRAAYAATLFADAEERIEPEVTEKAIVAGEVSAADYEVLLQRIVGLGWGISTEAARGIVRSTATALGVSLAVAPPVEYVLCGSCRSPQPEPEHRPGAKCRYCREALYTPCPTCGEKVESAATSCPRCGTSFQAYRAAAALVNSARGHLAAGRLRAGAAELAAARARLGSTRPPDEMSKIDAEIGAALRSAEADWTALARDVAARRVWSAYARAERLARGAVDVSDAAGVSSAEKLSELAQAKADIQSQVRAAAEQPADAAELALSRILTFAVDCPEASAALAKLPLASPRDVHAAFRDGTAVLTWRPSPAPGALKYRVTRTSSVGDGQQESATAPSDSATVSLTRQDATTTVTVGTTAALTLEDAGAPGGHFVRYSVNAVAGSRVSAAAESKWMFVERDVSALRVIEGEKSVELAWAVVPGNGVIVIERDIESEQAHSEKGPTPGASVSAGVEGDGGHSAAASVTPKRRIRPSESNRYVDTDCRRGVTYRYRVFVEYRLNGRKPVITTGRVVTGRVVPRPTPVDDLWATTERGRTLLNFARPEVGEVRVYVQPPGTGLIGEVGERALAVELSAHAEQIGARLVGSGRRRVVDTISQGEVVYTPVTVSESHAVVGAALKHIAVERVTNLKATDNGASVRLNFCLPAGATEALVRWRRDRMPGDVDDPGSMGVKVTSAKLEIDDGLVIEAPDDGRGLFIAVYPAVRIPGNAQPAPVPLQATLVAREPRPVEVRYRLTERGWLRRSLLVEIESAPDPLPALVLVARRGQDLPLTPGAGTVLSTLGGNGVSSATLEVPLAELPDDLCTLRLFVSGRTERASTVVDPPVHELVVSR